MHAGPDNFGPGNSLRPHRLHQRPEKTVYDDSFVELVVHADTKEHKAVGCVPQLQDVPLDAVSEADAVFIAESYFSRPVAGFCIPGQLMTTHLLREHVDS